MNEKDIEELLKPSTLFVELDAILDTRAGLLFNMSKKAFDMNVMRGLHKRSADVFEGVSETLYNKQYESRDSKALSNAQVTGIGKNIADFAKEVANRNLKTPVKNSCEIVLNLYPYILQEEEIGEIVLAISKLTLDLANISAVYMKPEEVSFDYIKENIDILYIYDYASWINANIDPLMELKGRMSPEVPMICPAVAKTKKISGYQHKDVFARMARAYAPMIGLDFIDVANFTMVLAPTLEQAAKAALRQPQTA
jgi:hypothetical protein